MYCPKCGQKQLAEGVRFCSQCGFSLVEVTDLLVKAETAGAPPEPVAPPKPRKRRRRLLLWAALVFLLVAMFTGANEVEGVAELFASLAVITFLMGMIQLAYGAIKRRRSRQATLGQQTSPIEAPHQHALPAAYVPPVRVPRARFDTGEIVEPPSVTEHTTRRLEQESPSERER